MKFCPWGYLLYCAVICLFATLINEEHRHPSNGSSSSGSGRSWGSSSSWGSGGSHSSGGSWAGGGGGHK